MRVALTKDESSFAHLPNDEVHWSILKETEGPNFSPLVYGVEFREGRKLFLLIPDRYYPEDVFFCDASQFYIVDSVVPMEWGLSHSEFNLIYQSKNPPENRFVGYPVFSSSEDFVWRLSEGDLTDKEWNEIKQLLQREY